ncbi:MAG: response regulator transcription factor [Acholeplasmataceae bacterium]|nr:response regulator transcription factor [Acholeplasmataceae bacterium]
MGIKILVVEDNKQLNQLFSQVLSDEGYQVLSVYTGIEALRTFRNQLFNLIILDLMLPDIDGENIIRNIRETRTVPILVISSKNRDSDKVINLNLGADDYLVKPFSLAELAARVKSVLRRSNTLPENYSIVFKFGNLTVDIINKHIEKNGELVSLTKIQSKIIELLVLYKDNVVSKEEIAASVWNKENIDIDNLINVNIRRIREKIEDYPNRPKILVTVWGMGYKMVS